MNRKKNFKHTFSGAGAVSNAGVSLATASDGSSVSDELSTFTVLVWSTCNHKSSSFNFSGKNNSLHVSAILTSHNRSNPSPLRIDHQRLITHDNQVTYSLLYSFIHELVSYNVFNKQIKAFKDTKLISFLFTASFSDKALIFFPIGYLSLYYGLLHLYLKIVSSKARWKIIIESNYRTYSTHA